MLLLRQLHLYTGLILSLTLFLIASSGAALLYKNEYWNIRYQEVSNQHVIPTSSNQAAAIERAYLLYGSRLLSLKMPEPDLAAYHVYLPDHEEALMDINHHEVIDEWRQRRRLMGLLFDVHAHLMGGEKGELVAGIVGIIGGLMAVSGLILWWPSRKSFSWKRLWPAALSRHKLLAWHRDAGMLLSPLLLLFILSGSAMVFYSSVQAGLNALFGDQVPEIKLPRAEPIDVEKLLSATVRGSHYTSSALSAPIDLPIPSSETIDLVLQVLPDSRLTFYYADALPMGFHRFRLKRDCELHPNGLSFVYTYAYTGEIALVRDACSMLIGERITNKIYPLHAAKIGSETYRMAGLLTALVLSGLAMSGVITYFQRIHRQRQSETMGKRL